MAVGVQSLDGTWADRVIRASLTHSFHSCIASHAVTNPQLSLFPDPCWATVFWTQQCRKDWAQDNSHGLSEHPMGPRFSKLPSFSDQIVFCGRVCAEWGIVFFLSCVSDSASGAAWAWIYFGGKVLTAISMFKTYSVIQMIYFILSELWEVFFPQGICQFDLSCQIYYQKAIR